MGAGDVARARRYAPCPSPLTRIPPRPAFHASFEAAEEQRIDVIGSEGTLAVPYAFTCPSTEDAVLLRDGEQIDSWRTDQYQQMVTAFAAAVAVGGPAPLPVDDALATARVFDQIRAAATPGPQAPASPPPDPRAPRREVLMPGAPGRCSRAGSAWS